MQSVGAVGLQRDPIALWSAGWCVIAFVYEGLDAGLAKALGEAQAAEPGADNDHPHDGEG